MVEGTWILLIGEQAYDPESNTRVTFTPDGRVSLTYETETSGTFIEENGRLRADFQQKTVSGPMYGALLARTESDRSASLSANLYWSSTGIPAGVEDQADPDDETADELWCEPCVLIREAGTAGQVD